MWWLVPREIVNQRRSVLSPWAKKVVYWRQPARDHGPVPNPTLALRGTDDLADTTGGSESFEDQLQEDGKESALLFNLLNAAPSPR